MLNIKKFLLYTSLSITTPVFATVGGPESIEILGYEAKDQKVYLLRHFEDGRGRLPQLYYYQFKNNKYPNKIIQVNSLYINPKTQKIDYDQNDTKFNQELNKIKKRLQPLQPTKVKNHISYLHKEIKQVPTWYDPQQTEAQTTYTYRISNPSFQSATQKAVAYHSAVKVSQQFMIPKQNKMLVTVQYRGIPFETGYDIEDPVLLLKK